MALDGSYITDKQQPSDVDVIVLTPGVYQLTGEQQYAAEGIDTNLLDIQFAHDDTDFDGWLAFFSRTRAHLSKGIVLLTDLETP